MSQAALPAKNRVVSTSATENQGSRDHTRPRNCSTGAMKPDTQPSIRDF